MRNIPIKHICYSRDRVIGSMVVKNNFPCDLSGWVIAWYLNDPSMVCI